MDFHNNVFYYYRGPVTQESQHERQLENNTTKALINTLTHCSSKVVLSFLGWLGITAKADERIKFELQQKSIGETRIVRASQRLLLGITVSKAKPIPEVELAESPTQTREGSIPDAWIYGKDLVVLIESKVGHSHLKVNQMRHHCQKLQAGGRQRPRFKQCLWSEVYECFIAMLPELSGQDKWLAKQLTQYLEWNNMAGFTGFNEEIFQFFVTHEDEDTRRWVCNTVRAFADELLPKLQAFDPAFYERPDVGKFCQKDDHCWVAFGPRGEKGGKPAYRRVAHQTVTVDVGGMNIFVNVELKHATDSLKDKVRRQKEAFWSVILKCQVDEFHIRMVERKQQRASIYTLYPVARLEAEHLKDLKLGARGMEYLETLIEQLPLFEFKVVKRLDRNKLFELCKQDQGKALIDEVSRIMKAFHPIVRFINDPV